MALSAQNGIAARRLLCPMCPDRVAVTTAEALRVHLSLTHFNLRPYPCELCLGAQKYPTAASLTRHLEEEHGVQEYEIVYSPSANERYRMEQIDCQVKTAEQRLNEGEPAISVTASRVSINPFRAAPVKQEPAAEAMEVAETNADENNVLNVPDTKPPRGIRLRSDTAAGQQALVNGPTPSTAQLAAVATTGAAIPQQHPPAGQSSSAASRMNDERRKAATEHARRVAAQWATTNAALQRAQRAGSIVSVGGGWRQAAPRVACKLCPPGVTVPNLPASRLNHANAQHLHLVLYTCKACAWTSNSYTQAVATRHVKIHHYNSTQGGVGVGMLIDNRLDEYSTKLAEMAKQCFGNY